MCILPRHIDLFKYDYYYLFLFVTYNDFVYKNEVNQLRLLFD